MTIAEEVADRAYPFTLRFILFGSEEVGLFGSQFYVDSLSEAERRDIIAMANFDALASGDVTAVFGSLDLTSKVLEYGRESGIEVERQFGLGGGSSDHAPFREAGVPFVFFIADVDFSIINSPLDVLELIEPERLGVAAALGIGLLDSLAGP